MSVINQVLKQLEQRGAQNALDNLHAVSSDKRSTILPWLVALLTLLLVLAAGLLVWQWMQLHEKVVPIAEPLAKHEIPALSAVSATSTVVPSISISSVPAVSAVIAVSSVPPAISSVAATEVVPHPVSQPVATSALQVPHKVPLVKTPPLQIKTPTTQSVSAVAVTSKAPDLRPTEPAVPIKKKPDSGNTDTSALKQVSPAQRADAEFHKATGLMQQGRVNEAIDGYEEALRLDAGHDASRQTLVTLLLEAKRNADAERVLKQGQEIKPEHTGFAMLLARIQVEHGALDQAIATLKKSLPYAEGQANYQAFLAALLQRNNLHNDAIIYYQIALRITPGNGIWLMGCGISLQAVNRNDDARQSYQRALDSKTLSPELQAFVRQKLKEL